MTNSRVPVGSGLRAGPEVPWVHARALPSPGCPKGPRGCRGGEREGRGGSPLPSPALPSPASPGPLLPDQLGLHGGGMSVNGAPWDPQGLQTVGIILLLCSSLKLLHALGIIDLTGGGGTKMGMGKWGRGRNGMGVLWWSCSLPPVPGQHVHSMYTGAARCSGEA